MELKWESLVRRCSVEKLFLKIQKILRKIYVPESRECGKDNSLWFCGIFRNIYFVEHLWTHTCVKWSNEKMFWQIYSQKNRGDGVFWSTVAGLRAESIDVYSFTEKGSSHRHLLVKLVKFCRALLLLGNCFKFPGTFLTYRFLYHEYINSVTTSCLGTQDIATCKWFTLLSLKIFKGNRKTGRE